MENRRGTETQSPEEKREVGTGDWELGTGEEYQFRRGAV